LSAEKKSLRRFLLIYIVSTLFLVGVGEWFYYKTKYHAQIDSQVNALAGELKVFLAENKGIMKKLRFLSQEDVGKIVKDFKIAVYKNGIYVFGSFKPQDIDFSKNFWIKNGNLFYLYTMPKRWGKVDIVVSKKLDESKISALKKHILLFNIFIFLFVFFIAYQLGKLFLQPLKKSITSLEEFIRDATHEMNTPISVILANIEMLKMKDTDLKELQRIEFSAKRLEKIFKDLTFVRFNHTQKKEIKEINIKDVVKRRIVIFQTLVDHKKIRILKECEDFIIKADTEDIVRIVDNLLSNALKYSPNNSEIVISLKDGVLNIANPGNIAHTDKVMSKFYRENQNEGGFGLGLYIVKKICDYYGFEFSIKNENGFVKTSVNFKSS